MTVNELFALPAGTRLQAKSANEVRLFIVSNQAGCLILGTGIEREDMATEVIANDLEVIPSKSEEPTDREEML